MDVLLFREFLETYPSRLMDWEVINLYLNTHMKVKEIARKTGKSIGEVYRIIERSGYSPNRLITNHHNVRMFADSGLPVKNIADLTGYTARNVRYVLRKV